MSNELVNSICALGLAGISAFLYLKANAEAKRLYNLESEESVNKTEADQWINRRSTSLKIFYGVGAILMILIGLISLYRFLKGIEH